MYRAKKLHEKITRCCLVILAVVKRYEHVVLKHLCRQYSNERNIMICKNFTFEET